jgi:hypothetical protein
LTQIKKARRPQASSEYIIARRIPMMDVVMLALAFVFFALSIGYVYGCDRL